jgi:endo-1,4-beta-xylanase
MTLPRPTLARPAALPTVVLVVLATLLAALGQASVGRAQSTSLRPLADDAGVLLGAAIDADALADDDYRQLLVDHVNLASTQGDLSMAAIQPEPGVFDFTRFDAIIDFAAEHDMVARGHELINGAVPGWVSGGTWTADSLEQVLREHVTAVVEYSRERHPGVVIQWDVVGDAFLADGTARPTIWQQVIGDDHLRIAFEAARAADPDAVLFYDDFFDDVAVTQDALASGIPIVPGANAERSTCDVVPKCVAVRDRMAALVAAGVPIDGIGFQSHQFSPDPVDLTQFTMWVGELGLDWAVTEFDVPLPVTEVANPESLEFQAQVYADALAACADAVNCDTFVTWGVTDRLSPIPAETGGAFDGALWLDANDAPKPAFDAMAQVLTQRGPPAPTASAGPTVEATSESTVAPDPAASSGDDGDDTTIVAVVVGLAALGVIASIIVIARRRRASTTQR